MADRASALRDAVHAFRQAMQGEGGSALVLPDWLPLPSKIRQRRAIRVVDDLIWKLIRTRRAAGGDDMLGQILAAVTDRPDLGISEREVRDEVATLFVAGHDTTSAAMAWLWLALSQHPEAEKRVLEEVDALGGRPVNHADVPRLKYLEMVVRESMRLYPATAFLFGREALQDVELGGYTLKRGSWVFISPYIVQRDARLFPDPETFDPERFAPGRADRIPAYSYLVFGAGARTCIGNALAVMELVLVAATVLQRYRLVLDQAPPEPEMEVVLRPKGGMRMRAEPRALDGTQMVRRDAGHQLPPGRTPNRAAELDPNGR
jgi:cytochrome P450